MLAGEKKLAESLSHLKFGPGGAYAGVSGNLRKSGDDKSNVGAVDSADEDPNAVHVIFSTDCKPYQDWQSLVLFHSAHTVGQKGAITRIASGCTDEKAAELKALYQRLWPNYHIHATPDFKKDGKTKKSYDFYNKPYGVQHWLANADPPVPEGTIIALLDPDMIFLRPITPFIAGAQNNIVSFPVKSKDIFAKVEKGKPVGQCYGLGAPWVNDNHKKFNRGRICGEGSPCLEVPNETEGWKYYSVGPPYILEKSDMSRLTNTWTKFVPRVYEKYPYLLAEMYAYSMAAAHERLDHLRMDHYMVSNTGAGGEGWPWVDAMQNVCEDPDANGIFYAGQPVPTVVHYCQGYRSGEWLFAKRRFSKTSFTCESPLLAKPPQELGTLQWAVKDGKRIDQKNKKHAKRNAFVVCTVYKAIEAAMEDFKRRECAGNPQTNWERTLKY